MFKNLINRGGCLIGLHQGEWEYLSAGSCEQKRICIVCETEQTRTEHDMGEWRGSDEQSCLKTSTCQRCGTIETEWLHTWGDWVYVADGACTAVQVCQTCQAQSEHTTEYHAWGKWVYSEAYRSPIHTCERCHAQEASFAVAAQSAPASTSPVADIMQSIDALNALSEANGGQVDDDMMQAVQALTNQIMQGLQGDSSPEEETRTREDVQAEMASASQSGADYGEMFGLLMEAYQSDIDTGKLSSEQQAKFDTLLGELGGVVNSNPDDLAGMLARSGKMRELMGRLADSSDEAVPHDLSTRLGVVSNYFFALDRMVKKEAATPSWSASEQEELANLFARVVKAKTDLVELSTDAEAFAHERQNLRQVAHDVRQYFMRHHLSVAKPIWSTTAIPVNPNHIYFAGSAENRTLIEQVCQTRQLDLLTEPRQKDPAQARWDQIRASNLTIFDMTAYDRQRETELTLTTQVGTVAYDMGIAFVLGKPMLVLAKQGQNLPFDIDIQPVILGGSDDLAVVGQALDDALYGLQRGGGESSVRATVDYLHSSLAESSDTNIRLLFDQLTDEVQRDAIQTRRILSQLIGLVGDRALHLITPTFPLSYPSADNPQCFHVTAFRDWARRPSELIEQACVAQKVTYRRGDQALDSDIIRSIWDEICQATHIVVDLTHLNANAVLELGMAQTLGRKVLAITQDRDIHLYFRSIAKLRVHQYEVGNPPSEQALSEKLAAFLRR